VHYVRGYLRAPASIDLSALSFLTTREPEFIHGDDEFVPATDDDSNNNDNNNNDDDDDVPESTDPPKEKPSVPTDTPSSISSVQTTPPPSVAVTDLSTPQPQDGGGEDGGNRRMQRVWSSFQTTRTLDDGSAKQVMDIVLFMVPENCKKDSWGTCDWAKLGVGAYDDKMEGGMSYCCSTDTAERGFCDQDDIGTLLVDHTVFQGDHRKVIVPQATDQQFQMEDPKFVIDFSGDYVLVISNCNDFGLEVWAQGSMEWKSVKGYLPGDMFELMLFYGALTAFYFFLVMWYYCGMRVYQDAAIPIQGYILGTMLLGFFEVLFRTSDFVIWNNNGLRNSGIMYTGQYMLFWKNVMGSFSYYQCSFHVPIKSSWYRISSFLIQPFYSFSNSHVSGSSKERCLALFGGHGCHGLGSCTRHFGAGISKDYHFGCSLFRINTGPRFLPCRGRRCTDHFHVYQIL
jgi:hypothetical protein